jgi:PAS domain S-box-containing protein
LPHSAASRVAKAGILILPAMGLFWLFNKAGNLSSSTSSDFMPHGYCYMWHPGIVWLHVISDALIALSYYAIPGALIYFIRKNRNLPFNRVFYMFAAFILACGTTHLLEIWNVWHADYLLAGVVKGATAAISLLTVAVLIPLLPRALSLSVLELVNRKLQEQIAERERSEAIRAEALTELAHQKFALDQHAIVATTDPHGTITSVNDTFCAISKYSREELIGANHRILNSGHHRKAFFHEMYHAIAHGRVWRGDICNRAKDGSLHWVDTTIVPLLDNAGKPRQYMAIRADITERKRAEKQLAAQNEQLSRQAQSLEQSQQALEEHRRMLPLVLDSMGEGLITTDVDANFLSWNETAKKLMGGGAANLPGDQWTPHDGACLPDGVTPFPVNQLPLARAIRGESVTMELMIEPAGPTDKVLLEVAARPLKNATGQLCGGVAVLRDITERKRAQRKAEELNQELELRVAQRTAELESVNHELEAFTYSVSHDLRAPLRHIGGFSRILLEDFASEMKPEAQRHVQRIEEGVGRMGLLVDELLNLARVGRYSLRLQPTALNPIIEEVVSLLQPEVNDRQVTWEIAQLPAALCDPILVKQIFQNLIANALKFTRSRPCPVIELNSRREENQLVVWVRDNGVGFDMKYRDKLFGVFQRLHKAEEFEGTGIGLATVHRIVNKHGGRVWAESELDKGATFSFTLELAKTNLRKDTVENETVAAGVQS